MKEYITLVAQHSNEIGNQLQLVLEEKIQEIKYKSGLDAFTNGGIEKAVSMPINVHKDDDEKFIKSCDSRQLEIKNIYD